MSAYIVKSGQPAGEINPRAEFVTDDKVVAEWVCGCWQAKVAHMDNWIWGPSVFDGHVAPVSEDAITNESEALMMQF